MQQDVLDAIPDTPGVYLFFDERDAPLYVGKSINLRTRVLSHFSADHSSSREMQIAQQTARMCEVTLSKLDQIGGDVRVILDRGPRRTVQG